MEYIPLWERDSHEEGVKIGMQKGVKEGLEKGANSEKLRTAKIMIEKGFDMNTIMDITGLNKEKIEKLSSTTH